MFVTNWISPTKIQKISEITNFFRHYFLSRTEVQNIIPKVLAISKRNSYLTSKMLSAMVVKPGRLILSRFEQDWNA